MKTNELAAALAATLAATLEREYKFQSRLSYFKSMSTALLMTIAFFTHNHSLVASGLLLFASMVIAGLHITTRDLDDLLAQVKKTKDQISK